MVIRKIGVEEFEEINFNTNEGKAMDVKVKEKDPEDASLTDSKSL
jgi:hypothetical protein